MKVGTRPPTVGDAFGDACRRLTAAGVASPRLDARLFLEHALDAAPGTALGQRERPLDAGEMELFTALVERRAAREPVARILGVREFWSLPFRVTAHTLVPRPDSETIVETALRWATERDGPLTVLDLGTGSGCLLLAVLHELKEASGLGVDVDQEALAVARDNARTLGLGERARFIRGDWGGGIDGRFTLVLANPPYVASGDLRGLEPEVAAFEPRRALDGGPDGLDAYRAMAPGLSRLLEDDGAAFIEVGAGQAAPVGALLERNGLQVAAVGKDLAGIERCITARADVR